jgi:ankyrin repeat protein
MSADIDHRDDQDLTALHHAVLRGFEDVVELLLNRGADVNAPSTTAGLPLCLAVLKDRSHIVRLLLDKFRAAVNLADPELGTPLHCAGFTGNRDIAEFLIQHGAEPELANRVELPKLLPYQDISTGKLVARGPWSRNYNWKKVTPLMIAVLAANLETAELLLGSDGDRSPSSFEIDGFERSCFHSIHAAARWGSSEMMTLTMAHTADVNLVDSDCTTALMGATVKGKPAYVRQLLHAGASRDACNSDGDSALILAGRFGFGDCLKELIDAGADLDLLGRYKMTAIMCASSEGYDGCVEQLAKAGASLNFHDKDGDTALILASFYGFDDCVKRLINAGASLDLGNSAGRTALIQASSEGRDDCVGRLIQAGASLDMFDTDGKTALIRASSNGRDGCVRQLIKAGASLEIHDRIGDTALIKASIRGQGDCVKHLIEAGTSVDQCNKRGFTALIYASLKGKQDCVDHLLGAGASLAAKTKLYGSTALHEAVMRGQEECAQILCVHGADVKARRSTGATPLYCAASNDRLGCAQILLKHRADPNLAEEDGWTPLMLAAAVAKPQSAAIVEVLLHAGADATAQTHEGDTALHMAARWNQNQTQIARLLLNAGASMVVVNSNNERPLDKAKPDSAVHAFLLSWGKGHNEMLETGPGIWKLRSRPAIDDTQKSHANDEMERVQRTEIAKRTRAGQEPRIEQETQRVRTQRQETQGREMHEERNAQKVQAMRKGWVRTSRRNLFKLRDISFF